jgi:hypothetical protein
LHLRVVVFDPQKRWRRKYDVSIPVAEIAPEAIAQLFLSMMDDGVTPQEVDQGQLTLDM